MHGPTGTKGGIGCVGYRNQPCACEKPLHKNFYYNPNDGEDGDKELICERCWGLTGEIVYVHVDKNLLGPEGAPGRDGEGNPIIYC